MFINSIVLIPAPGAEVPPAHIPRVGDEKLAAEYLPVNKSPKSSALPIVEN